MAPVILRSSLTLLLVASPAWSQDPTGTIPTPEGFTALIDKDLSNWRDAEKLAPNWKVQNGLLINDGKGQNAISAKSYRNFELWLDWKIPASGDSGVFLPGGQQIQIHAKKQSGAFVWNHVPPVPLLAEAANPIGKWNLEKNAIHCFKCSRSGNALDLWCAATGQRPHEAAIDLCERLGIPLPVLASERNREEEPVAPSSGTRITTPEM